MVKKEGLVNFRELRNMERILNSKHFISSQKNISRSIEFSMEEFVINKFIKLKLENSKTIIYVNNERFNQCKFLLLDIPIEETTSLEDIESIDDVAERLDRSLEHEEDKQITIPPKVEFWGHCSNLQVWYENDYNTKLIHRSLAFPLLKKLTEVGDKLAKKGFKEEIAIRYKEGNETVKKYLRVQGYLEYLDHDEFCSLFYGVNFDSFSGLLGILSINFITDKMNVPEFLEFIDSLNNIKLKDIVKDPKESNRMNLLQAILEDLGDYKQERSGKKIINKILKKIGTEYFDYLMKLLIEEDGYINLPVLESIVQIGPEKVKDFLNNTKHSFRFGFKFDSLRDFQHILNPLLVCFNPEELMNFLEKNHRDDFLNEVFPKMSIFKSLNMSIKDYLDMRHLITVFLLEEAGGDLYVENLRELGDFLTDIFLSELVDKHNEIVENIKDTLQWIGGKANEKLEDKLYAISHDPNIKEDKY